MFALSCLLFRGRLFLLAQAENLRYLLECLIGSLNTDPFKVFERYLWVILIPISLCSNKIDLFLKIVLWFPLCYFLTRNVS